MNTLKVVRAIAFGTAVVAAVISICIIVFKGLLANVNVTDEQFFVTVICICIIVFKGLLTNLNVTDDQFFVAFICICIIVFAGLSIDIGATDEKFLFTVIIFFISTLYALAVDAMIARDEAETADMKKIHQTTFNQCVVMMIISILGALSLVFL